MANCVARSVDIILSGLQYRFSSCMGGDVDIDHDDGVEVLNINLACDMEMYL